MTPEKCKAIIYSGGWVRGRACSRKATKDGFCGQHHPDAEKARRVKYDQKYRDRRELARQQWNIRTRRFVSAYLAWATVHPGKSLDEWEHEPKRDAV